MIDLKTTLSEAVEQYQSSYDDLTRREQEAEAALSSIRASKSEAARLLAAAQSAYESYCAVFASAPDAPLPPAPVTTATVSADKAIAPAPQPAAPRKGRAKPSAPKVDEQLEPPAPLPAAPRPELVRASVEPPAPLPAAPQPEPARVGVEPTTPSPAASRPEPIRASVEPPAPSPATPRPEMSGDGRGKDGVDITFDELFPPMDEPQPVAPAAMPSEPAKVAAEPVPLAAPAVVAEGQEEDETDLWASVLATPGDARGPFV